MFIVGADLEVPLAGDGRVQSAVGALLGTLFGPLVRTRGP